jgi:hypothetical protein
MSKVWMDEPCLHPSEESAKECDVCDGTGRVLYTVIAEADPVQPFPLVWVNHE